MLGVTFESKVRPTRTTRIRIRKRMRMKIRIKLGLRIRMRIRIRTRITFFRLRHLALKKFSILDAAELVNRLDLF